MPSALKSLIGNLNALMAKGGISQAELSRLSGVPQPHISAYLGGRTKPGIEAVEAMAHALGVTVGDLFGDELPVARPLPKPLETVQLKAIALILAANEVDILIAIDILQRGASKNLPAATHKRKPSAG